MLIRFRTDNHRSIRDEQELSFVAASIKDFPENVVNAKQFDIDLLKVIGIYGANASGKSTVLSALKFMQGAVVHSQRSWKPDAGVPRSPFLLDTGKTSEPSLFEVDILLGETRYSYGFVVDSKRVLEEWLYAYPQGRKQRWFTRDVSEAREFSFSRFLSGENKTIQSLTRSNSLFLSAAAQNNHHALSPIFQWFSKAIEFIDDANRGEQWKLTADIFSDSAFRSEILALIKGADLGITGIDVTTKEIPDKLKQVFQANFGNDPEFLESLMANWAETRVSLRHHIESAKPDVSIPFSDESRGTQALFGLAGSILQVLRHGGVLCVDELDASLHPLMAVSIVKMFNDSKQNPNNAQLLFNTHDTNILECADLRRDQIWFTEKDANGATHLYPLTDYKARKEENIKRGYLQGRYGAVPFINTPELMLTSEGNGKG